MSAQSRHSLMQAVMSWPFPSLSPISRQAVTHASQALAQSKQVSTWLLVVIVFIVVVKLRIVPVLGLSK